MHEQSERFRTLLIDFARSIGKEDAEVYVDDGFWKARQGGNGVAYAQKSVISFKPCATEENASITNFRNLSQKNYTNFSVHLDI